MTKNLKDVEKVVLQFDSSVEKIALELRKIQSQKCRLKKQKCRKDYNDEMLKLLAQEQILKESRQYLEPKEKFVTSFTAEDIKILDYDQTIKAIKSIQSKKCNSQFLTADINTNQEYQDACKIESMLLEHKLEVKPIDDNSIRKTQVDTIITELESLENISKEYVLNLLKNLK